MNIKKNPSHSHADRHGVPAWSQGAFRFGPDERAGKWDFSLQAIYQDSEDHIKGQGDFQH